MNANRHTAPSLQRPVLAVVVQQHAEETAMLRHVRSVLVRAPHVGLLQLGRLDERLAAHLDGLAVAGPAGRALCLAALERPGAGEVFALGVLALEMADAKLLDHLLALWPAVPEARRGLVSAYGWVSASVLKGLVQRLLSSTSGPALELGIEACRLHQADPGAVLAAALAHALPPVRAAAARAAGELGRVDLLPALLRTEVGEPEEVAFWKARSACLLGDRQQSLGDLTAIGTGNGMWTDRALALVMAAGTSAQAVELAQHVSAAARLPDAAVAGVAAQRRLIRTLALLGELRFVPWLIARMSEPRLARLAGEAFSWITGADLALLDLETLQAPAQQDLPDDADADGSLDEDDSLPWPEPRRVQDWWDREQPGLQAATHEGRLFMGQPMTAQAARRVLAEGTQRQRAHAALLACALQPGRPLFQVAAPTARQRRALSG